MNATATPHSDTRDMSQGDDLMQHIYFSTTEWSPLSHRSRSPNTYRRRSAKSSTCKLHSFSYFNT